ncbi:hypothetical protein FNH04_02555 [Streptomyces phyllanthi]|uniref:Uncharacterized protein n=1 Tax=Streptomyces phyllanthi TaxID=1803180 RepID=A0A5N8VVR4_9ACTN|nr:hypothetical protein [Streptomyces phyllanthi]
MLLGAEPPVFREPALTEGDDVRLLRDGDFFGFATDGAADCFADVFGWEALAHNYRRFLLDQEDDAGESLGEGYIRTTYGATGGDLVSVVVESGSLPDLRAL